MLTITHTDEAGTLLEGTARGDGSADVVKALGWRWGRSIGSWYLPRSRNVAPKRHQIQQAAQALTDAGFTVAVEVDATPQDRAEVEERKAAQAVERAARLTARAEREQACSVERWEAGRRIADSIPMGQPILLGHHSQRRAERDRDRIAAHTDASIAHQQRATTAAAAAQTAASSARLRHSPVTVANRIERLAADVRRDERLMARYDAQGWPQDDSRRLPILERLEAARADLSYWESVRAEQISTGAATNYGPDTVAKGDAVKIRGEWYRVVRANPKTVSVETGYSWVRRAPWAEVQAHRAG